MSARTHSRRHAPIEYWHAVTKDRRGGTKGRCERTKDDRAGTRESPGNDVRTFGNVVGAWANDVSDESSVVGVRRSSIERRCGVDEARRSRRIRVTISFSARSLEGEDDFRSPTPQSPPVGRGRNVAGPMSLFHLPTGGGEGVGNPVENPSMLRHGNPVRNG